LEIHKEFQCFGFVHLEKQNCPSAAFVLLKRGNFNLSNLPCFMKNHSSSLEPMVVTVSVIKLMRRQEDRKMYNNQQNDHT